MGAPPLTRHPGAWGHDDAKCTLEFSRAGPHDRRRWRRRHDRQPLHRVLPPLDAPGPDAIGHATTEHRRAADPPLPRRGAAAWGSEEQVPTPEIAQPKTRTKDALVRGGLLHPARCWHRLASPRGNPSNSVTSGKRTAVTGIPQDHADTPPLTTWERGDVCEWKIAAVRAVRMQADVPLARHLANPHE